MISAPGTGWFFANRAITSSAGGQLEHPSDVNNSTRTGIGPSSFGADVPTLTGLEAEAGERILDPRRVIIIANTIANTKNPNNATKMTSFFIIPSILPRLNDLSRSEERRVGK